MHLDPRSKSPEYLQLRFKRYRNKTAEELDRDLEVIDLSRDNASVAMYGGSEIDSGVLSKSFNDFMRGRVYSHDLLSEQESNGWNHHARTFESKDVPGECETYPPDGLTSANDYRVY